ncbi:hypothetical protein FB107DRAFT_250545 [Schizophyllum commune]
MASLASREALADPLVDQRLLPHIVSSQTSRLDEEAHHTKFAEDEWLRRSSSPRRQLEPQNTNMLEYCIEVLTRPTWSRTHLNPPRQFSLEFMSASESRAWSEQPRRQEYSARSAAIDTNLVARHFPEHIAPGSHEYYAPFYTSIFPQEFPMLERVAPELRQAARNGMLEGTPPTVQDLPTAVTGLDADRPTIEAYEMGVEIIAVLQEVLYYRSLRNTAKAREAASRLCWANSLRSTTPTTDSWRIRYLGQVPAIAADGIFPISLAVFLPLTLFNAHCVLVSGTPLGSFLGIDGKNFVINHTGPSRVLPRQDVFGDIGRVGAGLVTCRTASSGAASPRHADRMEKYNQGLQSTSGGELAARRLHRGMPESLRCDDICTELVERQQLTSRVIAPSASCNYMRYANARTEKAQNDG